MTDTPKFTLEIEKGDKGLWYVTSPEIKGLLLATRFLHRIGNDLDDALQGLADAGEAKSQEIVNANLREPTE